MKLSVTRDGAAAPTVTAAPDDFLVYTNANALYDSHEIRDYPRNVLDGSFDSLLHLRQSSCDDGQSTCGSGCMPEGADCCNGQSYCVEGTECTKQGRCSRSSSSSSKTSTTTSKSSSKTTSTTTTSSSKTTSTTSTTSSKTTSSSSSSSKTTSSKSSTTSSKITSSSSSSSTEESTTSSSTSSEESSTTSSSSSTESTSDSTTTTDDGSSTTLSDSLAQIIQTAVPTAAQTNPESACFLATQYTSIYTTPDWYKSMPSNAQSYYSSSVNIQASRTSFCTATAIPGSDGSDSGSDKSGTPPGTIAGAIVGSLLGLVLLAILIFWLIRSGKIKSPFARDMGAEEDPVMAFRGPLDGAGGGSSAAMRQSAYLPLVATSAIPAAPAPSHQQSFRSVSPESFVRSSQQGPMNFPVPPSLAAASGVPYQKRQSSYDTTSDKQYQAWPGSTHTNSMSGDTQHRGSVASQSVFKPPAAYGAAYLSQEAQSQVAPSPSPQPSVQIAPPPPVAAAAATPQLTTEESAEVLPPPGPPPASAERVHEMEAEEIVNTTPISSEPPRLDPIAKMPRISSQPPPSRLD